jgi:hypothetical protein
MSRKKLMALAGLALISILPSTASAVGNGVPFVFREGFVPAQPNPVPADSLDFTYHSCVNFTAMGSFTEKGYLWISSFQDVAGVVDSQINHFLPNGYHLYARYHSQGDQCSAQMTCPGAASRRNYRIEQAGISLYSDPMSNTVLSIVDCEVVVAGDADDVFLGFANGIQAGSQKSETNDLANGDFEIRFFDWAFTAAGQDLFRDGNNNPLVVQDLVFNANVTLLTGPLAADHRAEGSGNLYWID